MLATTVARTATAPSLDELVDEVERTGRYLEQATDASITTAIDRANDEGIAVVWIIGNDTEATAKDVLSVLDNAGSRYRTVVAIGDSRYWAESTVVDAAAAAELMVPDLTAGRVAKAIETFTASVAGNPLPDDPPETPTSEAPTASTGTGSEATGSGGGIPWIPVLLVGAAGFFAFRFFSGRRKAKRAEDELIEIDRAEIAEQLKNNADRVIGLGDQVIAKKEADLIRIYEEASTAYQEVSTELEHATTVEQINLLDDKIDKAEWQFEVIEARLDGRTPPPAPAPDTDAPPLSAPSSPNRSDQPSGGGPARSTDQPALGRDDSVLGRSGGRRSSGLPGGMGGMGGGLGGVLGGVLGGMLGGGRRPRTTSHRSEQRRQDTGSYGGGLGSGGLGRWRAPSPRALSVGFVTGRWRQLRHWSIRGSIRSSIPWWWRRLLGVLGWVRPIVTAGGHDRGVWPTFPPTSRRRRPRHSTAALAVGCSNTSSAAPSRQAEQPLSAASSMRSSRHCADSPRQSAPKIGPRNWPAPCGPRSRRTTIIWVSH